MQCRKCCFACEKWCFFGLTAFLPLVVNVLIVWACWVHAWLVCWSPQLFESGFSFWRIYGMVGVAVGVMCNILYLKVCKVGPGSPTNIPNFSVPLVEYQDACTRDGTHLTPPREMANSVCAKENGGLRFCTKCIGWKPDRSHHCSSYKRCVLKFDHFCPWFATAIGFHNHKFFALFLCYVTLLCFLCLGSTGFVFYNHIMEIGARRGTDDSADYVGAISVNVMILMVLALVFAVAVGTFSCFTLFLILTNQSTVEFLESTQYRSIVPTNSYRYTFAPSSKTVGNVFDVGWRRNWQLVMGDRWWMWVLPVQPSEQVRGNGTVFPLNREVLHKIRETAAKEVQTRERNQVYIQQQRRQQRQRSQYDLPQHLQPPLEEQDTNGSMAVPNDDDDSGDDIPLIHMTTNAKRD